MDFDIRLLDAIFNNLNEGILIGDIHARIIYFNKAYSNFIGKKLDEVRGDLITDIRPGAKLPQVLKTGKAADYIIRKEWEEEYFCSIYPMTKDGEIVGAISIVLFMNDVKKIRMKLKDLEDKTRILTKRLKDTNGAKYSFDDIITYSYKGEKTKDLAKKLARRDVDILIQGETGTGKELFAQSIHNESDRRHESFIAINCSAFPNDILESELFGYEEGAFTGAKEGGKIGLFEAANNGSIFLDEISEMDLSLQAKLLRVIQERKIRRLGAIEEKELDVRIICACNVDLKKYVEENKFREDLYYRISIIPLKLSPLRERKEDIGLLANKFLADMNKKLKKTISFSSEAEHAMLSYDWPGNIRELRNIVEFSSLMTKTDLIGLQDLPDQIKDFDLVKGEDRSLKDMVGEYEKKVINSYIEVYGSSLEAKKKIAKMLNISLASLYSKMKF